MQFANAILCLAAAFTSSATCAGELPEGFVFLADLDPGIVQRMDYAGPHNFTKARVPGYDAAECILSAPTAKALVEVQQALVADGRALIVHDCYRPARAVRHFVRWTQEGGAGRDRDYHPFIDRDRLIEDGYIAARSGHSSGGSVDVSFGTLRGKGSNLPHASVEDADLGGRFDLFDASSRTASRQVSLDARRNRTYLVRHMAAEGFANYPREWWHFRFKAEPFPQRVFDFAVTARPR